MTSSQYGTKIVSYCVISSFKRKKKTDKLIYYFGYSYVIFTIQRRQEIRKQLPNMPFPKVTKLLGNEWSAMTPEQKQVNRKLSRLYVFNFVFHFLRIINPQSAELICKKHCNQRVFFI